ncbi:HhH-GPD-type base excision DNA repair protein [Microlunatus capsulatus]|uniref:HhH-GPD family protein n=1 Tax=Microlunatus capsulatus TaxID=99117 RepID=A0ABS4Z2N6_9ACTN|nr:HhH-GPD-type base excision DNA repair protein [Microlunatus capsulatus]MBP2415266.1 putative HhH-GPD family protein [Microlunatus capsulatus]
MTSRRIWLTGDDAADDLLTTDDNALLLGMVLDQQVAMEKAFAGPAVIAERMGGRLDVAAIAAMEEDAFIALCSERPAVHRFPGAMAKRVRQVCQVLVEEFDGDAANVWRDATTGAGLKRALLALPGFGEEKATIFVAVLAKHRGVTPTGWEEAAGPFGQDGFRSVADVVDEESLARVRESKRAVKATKKAAKAEQAAAG